MTMDIWFWFWSLTFYLGLSAIVLTRSARAPRQRYVDAWAGAHGLDLDPGERRMVTAWLRRSRWLRAVGFVLPFLSIGLGRTFWAAVKPETPFPLSHRLDWWLALIGYLLGVIVAEVSRRRSPPAPATGQGTSPGSNQAPVPADADDRPIADTGPVPGAGPDLRAAALVPRRLGDYRPAWLPRTTRLVALATAAAGVALVLLPVRSGQGWTDDPVAALGTGLTAVLVAGATELLARWLVGRRQPITQRYRLALDDALRSTSVHATGAAGLALVLLLLARQFDHLAGVDAPIIGWVGFLGSLACLGVAIGCLIDLAQHHRRTVRRGLLQPAGGS
jgi:hypothetical protein